MNQPEYVQWYERVTEPIRQRPAWKIWLQRLNIGLTGFIYAEYLLLLAWLLFRRDRELWMAVLTPGIPFLLVSAFRRFYNAARPYEKYQICPLIPKDKKGNSFPSRHVFSAFVIAVTLGYFFSVPGLITWGAGILLAVIRVVGGVHFPRDVFAGAAIGAVSGFTGLYLGRLLL